MKAKFFAGILLAFCSGVESSDLKGYEEQESNEPYVKITEVPNSKPDLTTERVTPSQKKTVEVITIEKASPEEIRSAAYKVGLIATHTNEKKIHSILSQILRKEGNANSDISVHALSQEGFSDFNHRIFQLFKNNLMNDGEKAWDFYSGFMSSVYHNKYIKEYYNFICNMVKDIRIQKKDQEKKLHNERIAIAQNLMNLGLETEVISKATNLSVEEINLLQKS